MQSNRAETFIVGNPDCSFDTVVDVVVKADCDREEYNRFLTDWVLVADTIDVSVECVHATKRDLVSKLITFSYSFHQILTSWRSSKSYQATLQLLLVALEKHDFYDISNNIRKAFQLPVVLKPLAPPFSNLLFEQKHSVKSVQIRKHDLDLIHTKLFLSNPSSDESMPKLFVVVSGMAGIGKTQLSIQYKNLYGENYDNNIIWLNAGNRADLKASFHRLADDNRVNTKSTIDNKPKSLTTVANEVYSYLSPHKILFVFNNVDDITVLKDILPPKTSNRFFVLITSRLLTWSQDTFDVINLKGLTQPEALEFVNNFLKSDETEDYDSLVQNFRDFQKDGRYYPLALYQALEEIRGRRRTRAYTIADYIQDYKVLPKKLLNSKEFLNNPSFTTYETTTLKTFLPSMEAIVSDENYGQLAERIFNIIVFLSPDRICKEIFRPLVNGPEFQLLVDKAVDLLVQRCLIQEENQQSILCCHRVVQQVFRSTLGPKCAEVIKDALNLVKSVGTDNLQHVTSAWVAASAHCKLVEDFYEISQYVDNVTPLHLLANKDYGQNTDAFVKMLTTLKNVCPRKKFQQITDAKDKYDRTPLWIASSHGDVKMVQLMVTRGATTNTKTNIANFSPRTNSIGFGTIGWTPLHVAAHSGHFECVKILHKANPDLAACKDSLGRIPLLLAMRNWHKDIVNYFVPEKSEVYNLHCMLYTALKSNTDADLESVKRFILSKCSEERSILLNSKADGRTIFQIAVRERVPVDVIKFLIQNGAKVYNKHQASPLQYATENGYLEIVKCLVEHGAHPVTHVNDEGWTALHASCQNGRLKIVRYFLEEVTYEKHLPLDVIMNVPDFKGDTPLHTAAFHGKPNVVKYLLERGAKVNQPDDIGVTPVMSAAFTGFFDVVQLILKEKGEELIFCMKDVQGNETSLFSKIDASLLHLAAAYDSIEVVKYLVDGKGLDVNLGMGSCVTPLHVAVFFNSGNVIKYLVEKGAEVHVKMNFACAIEAVYSICIVEKPNMVTSKLAKFIIRLINGCRKCINYFVGASTLNLCHFNDNGFQLCKLIESSLDEEDDEAYARFMRWKPNLLLRGLLSFDLIKKQIRFLQSFVEDRKISEDVLIAMDGDSAHVFQEFFKLKII